MAGELMNFYDGEPWLDNPSVFLYNKRKRTKGKKAMARRRRRGRKAAPPRRRRRVVRRRRASLRSNPPVRRLRRRRRVSRKRSSLRGYRRNPSLNIAGLNLGELLKGAGAVIVAPMLEKQILALNILPASVSGTSYGRWAVKIGAALGTWYGAKAVFGRRSADVVAIALGSSLIADAVQEFAPSITGLTAYQAVGPVSALRAYSRTGRGLGLVMPGQMTRRSGLRGIGPNAWVSQGASSKAVFSTPF